MKFIAALLLLPALSYGTTIAVIDSGVDVEHVDLVNNIWMNAGEVADNGRDDDTNGYQDDVYGWNFAEQNNLVIDRKYIGTFSNDPYKFFEVQGRMLTGEATEADMKWLESKKGDPKFAQEMQKFGNFIHGTHVAGITVEESEAKILSVKLIPTEVKPFMEALKSVNTKNNVEDDKDLRMTLIKALLTKLAGQQMLLLEEIASYVGGHNADIANGSFGTGYPQAKMICGALLKVAGVKDPTEEQLNELAQHFLSELVREGKKMVDAAPNTLFVFAAGNDGSNNDKYPASPTNVQADNVLSVAATFNRNSLASFSNYGKKMVDVAAPGVLIHSQIPGNEYLKVSGTSQAAPYVSNIAAQVKSINKGLTPVQIKKIIMGTVDYKDYLKAKVKSEGIVNLSRARTAAHYTLSGRTVDSAISQARAEVLDVETVPVKSFIPMELVTPIGLTPEFKL